MNQSFFSSRIGRLKFLAYLFIGFLLMSLAMKLVIILNKEFDDQMFSGIWSSLYWLPYVAWLVWYIILSIKRFHDIDVSGFYVLIPIILMIVIGLMTLGFGAALVLFLSVAYFGFKKGTSGPNRFGEDPLLKLQG